MSMKALTDVVLREDDATNTDESLCLRVSWILMWLMRLELLAVTIEICRQLVVLHRD